MRISSSRLILPAALFVCLPLAAALNEMSASAEGRGAISIQGQSLPVTRAEVSLIPGGRFIVSLTGEQRYAFRGEWQDQGSRIALTIKEAQGAAAEGTGELRLRSGQFRTIQISGANRAFDASFTVTGAYKDFTAGGTTSDVIKAPVAPQISAPRVSTPYPEISAPIAPSAPTAPSSGVQPPKITVQGSGTLVQARNDRKSSTPWKFSSKPTAASSSRPSAGAQRPSWREPGAPALKPAVCSAST